MPYDSHKFSTRPSVSIHKDTVKNRRRKLMSHSHCFSYQAPAVCALFLTFLLAADQAQVVDAHFIILGNAKIYTVDDSKPWAEAVAIDDGGNIVAVGTESEVDAAVADMETDDVDYIDMNQRLILPGFQDVHIHAVQSGIFEDVCYIPEDVDIRDIPFIFQNECESGGVIGDQGWIVGGGIDIFLVWESLYLDANLDYPITILDRAFPNTPVLIVDNLGHGALANTRAMEIVGYDLMTGDPPGGIIDRDPDTKQPTGILLENAQQPMRDASFPPTQANMEMAYQGLLRSLEVLAANGITSVSDAGGYGRQAQTESWALAESNGMLTVRASNCLYVYPDTPIEDQLADLKAKFTNDPNALVRFNQAKIYVDGILSMATAALYEPYLASVGLSSEEELGFEYFGDAATLTNVAQTLVNEGFQLNFHVIGDRAAGLALDAIEASSTSSEIQHRLTHVYMVAEQDKPRFASLNVVADFQLSPSTSTMEYREILADELIGSERAASIIPVLEMYESGAPVVISSDWDADELSPLTKLSVLLSRPNGPSLPDLETAIPLMTLNPAKVLQHENKTGSIEVGKFADFVILNDDIFSMAPDDIRNAEVAATLLQGDAVFDPDGLFGEPIGLRTDGSGSGHTGLTPWCVWGACFVSAMVLGVF